MGEGSQIREMLNATEHYTTGHRQDSYTAGIKRFHSLVKQWFSLLWEPWTLQFCEVTHCTDEFMAVEHSQRRPHKMASGSNHFRATAANGSRAGLPLDPDM